MDTHRDHKICAHLTYDARLQVKKSRNLYFYGAKPGSQTQNFIPTDYPDITNVASLKHKACFAHINQKIEKQYPNDHGRMEEFRGLESGSQFAEAYVRLWPSPQPLMSL